MPDKFISAVRGYLRMNNLPLDASSVYESFQLASEYASDNPTAYAGQIIAVADESTRTVTIYQLGYKLDENESGFELQSLSTSGAGATVRSVNGIEPDIDGNITIDLEHLDQILTFLEDTPEAVVFSKPIAIETNDISLDSHVISKGYLEASIDRITNGMLRTLNVQFSDESLETTEVITGGSVIKKATVRITEAFNSGASISISIDDILLFSPNDIYETIPGVYIAEFSQKLDGNASNEYPVVITVTDATQGSAELYVDFNIDYID